MISGFSPIIAKHPKVLIVGSMPSVTSLEKQEYYGFKQNRFWKIMGAYFKCEFTSYEEKKQCILDHHLILWDVIKCCEREGSLDSAIINEVCNDMESLIKQHPDIKYVLCNGKKSYTLFMKHFKHLDVKVFCMPSTSNANRSISEKALFQQWFEVLNACF